MHKTPPETEGSTKSIKIAGLKGHANEPPAIVMLEASHPQDAHAGSISSEGCPHWKRFIRRWCRPSKPAYSNSLHAKDSSGNRRFDEVNDNR